MSDTGKVVIEMRDSSETSDELEEFLYRVTHDMKGYIRAIRVLPDWVVEDISEHEIDLPESVVENLTMLQTYAQGMDRMLEGLTDLSRVGRLSDTYAPHDLEGLVEKAWKAVPDCDRFVLDASLDGCMVLGPENDLLKLLGAVLSNAVVHHEGETGVVAIAAQSRGNRVFIRVEDDGPGIDPDYREKIFEPLTTLQPKEQRGTAGLGLTVAQKIVRMLSGSIRVSASSGASGCVFEFDLPAA